MKELFIQVHEELIEEYMEAHPGVSWSEAYEKTADSVGVPYREKFADMVDEARDRKKYEGIK